MYKYYSVTLIISSGFHEKNLSKCKTIYRKIMNNSRRYFLKYYHTALSSNAIGNVRDKSKEYDLLRCYINYEAEEYGFDSYKDGKRLFIFSYL